MKRRELIDYIPVSPDRISMTSLARTLGENERVTRKMISDARINGEIIGSDSEGYYIPIEPQEMASYYRIHHKRAMTCLRGLKAVRKALRAAGVDIGEVEGRKSKGKA